MEITRFLTAIRTVSLSGMHFFQILLLTRFRIDFFKRKRLMKTRNYGIDFLRMISMIMIVMLHTLGHGGILRSVSFLSVHYQIAWLLEVIAFGAVNTYAMISGFVSVDSHFKISNILILWLQVLFYGILINTVFFFLLPESRNTSGWIQALFPVTRKEYWYFTAYAGVFFLSPFINQMFRNLSEKQIKLYSVLLLSYFLWFRPFHRLLHRSRMFFIWATDTVFSGSH